ncbi:R3H domain-containing protein, variant [Neurospora crassa OR74A]|uniref:R3H domain-containing protein, variant n=1 Tax=Neurospora crassa (strain ATCC 24698 / 74-OR23-1A / CBS 708.71 / DSM 1257 / FGSC 987) TaxID=367110 RepID=V5IPT4_NEUCR|nr:R3H domain-containing protein, variant [Neurospora crassa OR74A]ESA43529.1 R3H domain-containing protein, variant [Neurospora crassa OR74A]|eukprot:XP_011393559.1 R3H domain-containing protein, variant [Neurospora crassa OR74A]
MNPQPDISGYFPSAYPMNNANRSPGSSRPGYNTAVGLTGVSRMTQRQMEAIGQPSAALFAAAAADDRFASYDNAAFRHNRLQPAAAFATDSFNGNNQAWAYNAGANTVNGALGDNRVRNGGRRALPTEWMSEQNGLGSHALNTPSTQYSSTFGQSVGLLNGDGNFAGDRHGYPGSMYDPRHDSKTLGSDLIPTAIVIKNIPFNVRKEMLTQIMTDLGLPQPYAFNYHFDNGIFRGLAFANFQSPLDTQTVIEQLNGYEVQGRKLRVEYKKMLPEHERERIEREKREKRGQLEEQHQPIALHSQSSMHSLNAAHTSRSRNSPLRDVDLNNPETLKFYTELTLFRNDPNREIIIFPASITPQQRRTVHILAHNMGLEHRSVGEGPTRQLHVIKDTATATLASMAPPMHISPGVSADAHRRGLSRAATIDFAESRANAPGQFATLGRQGRHGPTLELPDSPDGGINALRGVKSFADLRSYTPSPSLSASGFPQSSLHSSSIAQYGEYSASLGGPNSVMTTPTTPGAASNKDTSLLISDLGSLSLSEPFNANRLRPRETPGAIGSQRSPLNGNSTRSVPERQPHGPSSGDWGESIGFAGRGRTNGHMQRDSDSSDNGTRGAATSASSRFQ